ncbi:MAG: sigma-70 family RNA polymerase sigma factor [Deltaproteobacteria bacterium]|nr:sigma-70 family RNA polymerase sigma factor [Deltaproteobacteria bacterium]
MLFLELVSFARVGSVKDDKKKIIPKTEVLPAQKNSVHDEQAASKAQPATGSRKVSRYDPLDAFLREIQQYPLLSPEEEKDLAESYVKTGDVQVAAKLVTSNLRLVVKIAFQYRRAYRNIMDLIQEGNIGLMQAVKKYDPSRGVKLSSYAAWWIRAYILRFVLNNWRLVKLGTTQAQRKLFFNLNKERARIVSMGEDPTPGLLAERLGVTEKEVIEMDRRLKSHDVSLDAEINVGEGRPLTRLDMLEDNSELQDELIQDARFDNVVHDKLEEFATPLTDKEDYIFRKRLIVDDPLTLQQIGDQFGVSRERVRQIEKRLLSKLRKYLVAELPEYFGEEVDI